MNHPRFIYGDPIYGYYYNLRGDIEPIPPPPPLPYIPPPPPLPYIISISNEHSFHIATISRLLFQINAPPGTYTINSFPGSDPISRPQELYLGNSQWDPPHYTIRSSTAQELQNYRGMHLYVNPPVRLTRQAFSRGSSITISIRP